MTTEQKELYEKTMRRIRRAGCFDVTDQIIYLAEEIEHYRARIQGLEQMQAAENLDPAEKVWGCVVTAYTVTHPHLNAEESMLLAKAEMNKRLVAFLEVNGAIEYTTNIIPGPAAVAEHTAVVRVVMPKKGGRGMTLGACYKCRLCGQKFLGGKAGEEVAERCMEMLHVGLLNPEPMAPTMTTTHRCGGDHAGSLGLADFLGWEKEDEA